LLADTPSRWQCRESRTEALHAPTLLVNGDDQRRAACGVDCSHELRQLFRVRVVPGEENDAANERMPQQLALLGRHSGPEKVDHQRPKAHIMHCAPGAPAMRSIRRESCGETCPTHLRPRGSSHVRERVLPGPVQGCRDGRKYTT